MPSIGLLLVSLLGWAAFGLSLQKTPAFVSASFVDKNRLFVEDLSREEVRVYENGQLREVEFFAQEEVPAVYGLLFDRAILPLPYEEMRRDRGGVPSPTAAANIAFQLIDRGLGSQVGWVGTYDTEMRVVFDVSSDRTRIKETIQQLRGQRSQEDSSLYGALFAAVNKMSQRHEKRRVLIVFLDVVDVKTVDKLKPLKNLFAASNIELFVTLFAGKSYSGRGLSFTQSELALRELADVTAGGAYFTAYDGIEELGRRISNQIRTFYTLGFQSESPSEQPGRLKVECTRAGVKVKSHQVVTTLGSSDSGRSSSDSK